MLQLTEWIAVLAALIYIYLATLGKRSCFIYGLVSSVLFVYICGVEKLYFDTAINAYYVIMSVVGWFAWGSTQKQFNVYRMPFTKFVLLIAIFALISLLLGYLAARYTDAQLSYIDSFTTVFAALATWMLVRQFIENWLLWIAVDGVSVFMYGYKDHWPIAGLFFVYTVIAIFGFYKWKTLETKEVSALR